MSDEVQVHLSIRVDVQQLQEMMSAEQIAAVLTGIAQCLSAGKGKS